MRILELAISVMLLVACVVAANGQNNSTTPVSVPSQTTPKGQSTFISPIPAPVPIIQALVDSHTDKQEHLFAKTSLKAPITVYSEKTTYDYLLQDGGHLSLDSKIQGVPDLRSWSARHPGIARLITRLRIRLHAL